ncbi:MAG: DUF1566 domain-containing protein [Treponema sp.]|jgi:hypothetical protein|nr:DUF1566 domain-containing protein [Treponema sp.]
MKKMVFCIIPLIMILMGCASSGTAVAKTGGNSPGMDLDAAIREAAAQMEAKIPSKTMVALVSVASPSTAFSTQVLTRLESAIVSSGKLVVVDRANLDKVREEQGFQLSGEVDDESAKSIGKLLGAGAIVTGSLADLGDVYSLTLKAINIETATVAVSYLADLAKSPRIETLLASGGGAAGTGTRTAPSASKTVAPAAQAPAAPPAPTYKIGDTGPSGGIVFYDKFSSSGGWRYLETAPVETEQQFPWGDVGVGGTSSALGDGKRNTQLIVEELRKKRIGGAAQYCDDLEYGGYTDWFLPSNDELNLMYQNLKEKGLGGFTNDVYWSSSVHDNNFGYSFAQRFNDGFRFGVDSGYANENHKSRSNRVRAVRAF